jgi:hypothetical protein
MWHTDRQIRKPPVVGSNPTVGSTLVPYSLGFHLLLSLSVCIFRPCVGSLIITPPSIFSLISVSPGS